jgi:soluble lytic murein transglycosylase-like protein
MSKQLQSGASVPMANRPKILVALNKVADAHDVDPAAIAAMIHLESVWDTKNVTGQ